MQALTPFGSGALRLGAELGKGGEGSVYTVTSSELSGLPPASELVAKIYHEPLAEERPKKLKAMISSPVQEPSVAWPLAVIVDDHKRFLGYLMKRLDSASYREWLYIANPKDRRKVAPAFDVRYAFTAVRNLAAALMAVHSTGHRVGDINESNIFLGADATVLIVDTDSMQVKGPAGEFFPCPVGKPEFTAPELTYGSLRDTPRSEETDIFAFAVAAYQLLLGGSTPHQGAFDPSSEDDPPTQVERIRKGILPALDPVFSARFGFSPRPGVPVEALPEFLKAHLEAFLSVRPEDRNGTYRLSTLLESLDRFIPTLEKCPREAKHWLSSGEICGWCSASRRSGQDPWGSIATVSPPQAKLEPISFRDHSFEGGTPRAAAAVAGTQAHSANRQAAGLGSPPPASHSPSPAGSPASPVPTSPGPQNTLSTPTQTQRPHKVKGKVTVEYADGSWGVRPSLGLLMRSRPKIALWALKEETPDPLKFWWPVDRDLAKPGGLWLGLLFSVISAVSWYFLTSAVLLGIPELQFLASSAQLLALIPAFTAILAGVFLLLSGFTDRGKARKRYGNLKSFREESTTKTFLRFLPLGFFYGLPVVLVIIFLVIYLLIIFVRAVAKA